MKMLRVIISCLAVSCMACLCKAVTIPDSIRESVGRPGAAPCEGVWQFARDGAVIAIMPNTSGNYDIISLDSPDLYVPKGAVLGSAGCISGDGKEYELSMFTGTDANGNLVRKRKFVASVTGEGNSTISLVPRGASAKLNFWVLYRFFVNMSVRSQKKEKKLEATRIFPYNPCNTINPIVL